MDKLRACFYFCVGIAGVIFAALAHGTLNHLVGLLVCCIGGWGFGYYGSRVWLDWLLTHRK